MTETARQVQLVDTPGGRLFISEADQGSVARALRKKGRYEKEWTAWVRETVRPGMHALDVGANVGYYTVLLASLVGPSGSVVACEPDPINAGLLRRTIDENRFAHVRLVEAAVSDGEGRATLFQDASWHGVHSLALENCVNRSDRSVDVPTVTIDGLLAGRGGQPFDFVKMDAQGAEASILLAAGRLLAQPHVTVLMELWPQGIHGLGGTLAGVTDPFRVHGFASFTMGKDRRLEPLDQETLESRAATLGTWSSFNVVWSK